MKKLLTILTMIGVFFGCSDNNNITDQDISKISSISKNAKKVSSIWHSGETKPIEWPQWLKNANITWCDVDIYYDDPENPNGRMQVVWNDGEWNSGEWGWPFFNETMSFASWYNGTWHNGIWHGGLFGGGDWYNGTWEWGMCMGGRWHGGTYISGPYLGCECVMENIFECPNPM